jgi:prophage tail gpP-like protein
MAPESSLGLLTGGRDYAGWKSVRVVRSMSSCAGSFELGVAELWPGAQAVDGIRPGEKCELRIGNDPVVTGYVDTVELQIDAAQHEVQVTGRDSTADLVDCSALRKPGQWRGQRVERIAQDLAEPFGVKVRVEVDTGRPLASFALQEGESVFEAIERAARMRALLLMSDGTGALVITRAGLRRVATPLVMGSNILSGRAALDMRDRFSLYVAKGQAPGSDTYSGAQVAQIAARATDPGVHRYRPLVLTGEAPDLGASLRQRVEWEANVRAASAMEVEVTVNGWRHEAGLWEPNTIVKVSAPVLRLDHELLVHTVQYSLDEGGQVATLAMTRADAYSTLALAEATGSTPAARWWNIRQRAEQPLDLNGPSFNDLAAGG